MSFDISSLDVATGADKGAPMEVLDPRTKLPARDDDGNPITITLYGGYSRQAEASRAKNAERRGDMLAAGIKITREMQDQMNAEFLAGCTAGWSFATLDGQPFAFSTQNALRFWADRRFADIANRALLFIGEPANFMHG